MTQERKNEFYAVAFKDAETTNKLLAKTPEEVKAFLDSEGKDFSLDEIKEIGAEFAAHAGELNEIGELSESDLQNVAGGGNSSFWAGVATGAGIGAGVCFAGAAVCACCW
jgi:hypothetical protein